MKIYAKVSFLTANICPKIEFIKQLKNPINNKKEKKNKNEMKFNSIKSREFKIKIKQREILAIEKTRILAPKNLLKKKLFP